MDDHIKVKATPLHNRFRDAVAGDAQSPSVEWPLSRVTAKDPPPSSGVSVIPATAPRKSFRDALQNSADDALDTVQATPARPPLVDRIDVTPVAPGAIAATPARQTKTRDEMFPAEELDVVGSSPLMQRKNVPRQLPGPIRTVDSSVVRSLSDAFRTPVKKPKPSPSGPAWGGKVDEKAAPAEPGKKMSVYERLGWDNDFDDL